MIDTKTILSRLSDIGGATAAFVRREMHDDFVRGAVTISVAMSGSDAALNALWSFGGHLIAGSYLRAGAAFVAIPILTMITILITKLVWQSPWWKRPPTHLHYKGGEYRLEDIGFCVERQIPVAIYRGGAEPDVTFVRSLDRFDQKIHPMVPRFMQTVLDKHLPARVLKPVLPKRRNPAHTVME